LPSSGPDTSHVVKASEGPQADIRIVDITDNSLSAAPPPDFGDFDRISKYAVNAPVDRIEIGDTLQITVYEIGSALFTPSAANAPAAGAALAPTATAAALPVVPVGPDGDILLPYVGRVKAAGLTPNDLAEVIRAGLRGKSQSPQVVVTVHEDVGNTIVIMGDVKFPGRKPLSYRREHLLDMVAIAGGASNRKNDTIVRLTRNGRTVETVFGDIDSGSIEDVALEPQDRIELIYRPRTFTGFGATGKVSQISFDSDHLSLAEALARMGGPLDPSADPAGVFVFRAHQNTDEKPVVYRLNLKDPKGFFIAQQFQVQDKDLIYVANSEANAWYKFMAIINSVISPVVTAKYIGQ
jgi:polysaccharide export outer membrane protein